jgi:hypothetical protein
MMWLVEKGMFKKVVILLWVIGWSIALSGCGENKQPEQEGYQIQTEQNGDNGEQSGKEENQSKGLTAGTEEVALRAKQIAYTVDGVKDVAAVVMEKELSLAADVVQMKRFQLKGIRKEIFHKLREAYPDYEIHVSTDRKILRELKKLEKVPSPYSWKERQRLSKINEDMKG